jgi:asparagine synthase (glutamine-hydrolysing)
MCGIAGYIGPRVIDPQCSSAASLALRHRGPDGCGAFSVHSEGFTVVLVHQRLAIIDLDRRSNQPFRFDESVLAFNGEIYNYIELRRELRCLGHEFQTSSDTEVLAHALREWGMDALDRLEGMWAFAWYDERREELILCRDRFGEKPLYVWRRDEGIYFSSEVKGLAALSGLAPEPNVDHLLRYLVNGYKALHKTAQTFFREVEELPARTFLRVARGGATGAQTYWSTEVAVNDGLSYTQAVTSVRAAVEEAVRIRLRSDVPLAFCMSGGVDSNTLISIARRVFGSDVHGFTIANTDARYEESALVEAAVEQLELRHTSVVLSSSDFIPQLKSLVAAHDAPIYTISYYVHWQLMRAIADAGYKVAFSGTGADELFTGYYDHHNLYLAEISADEGLYSQALAAWRQHVAPTVRNPHLQEPELFVRDREFRAHIYLNSEVFASSLRTAWMEPFTEARFHDSLLRNRMLNELFVEAVPVMLHEDDLNAMYYSIENRSPFLDRRLFEVAYSIPTRYLVRDGHAKAVLRDAMRGIVPDLVLNSRRKVGFNAPVLELLDTSDPDVRAWILDEGPIYDLVRREEVERILGRSNLPNSFSKFLFNFVCAKAFLEEFGTAYP